MNLSELGTNLWSNFSGVFGDPRVQATLFQTVLLGIAVLAGIYAVKKIFGLGFRAATSVTTTSLGLLGRIFSGIFANLRLALPTGALMFVGGLTSFGYGVGELRSGAKEADKPAPKLLAFEPKQLQSMAEDKNTDQTKLSEIFNFTAKFNEAERKSFVDNLNVPVAYASRRGEDKFSPARTDSLSWSSFEPAAVTTAPAQPEGNPRIGWALLFGGVGTMLAGFVTAVNGGCFRS